MKYIQFSQIKEHRPNLPEKFKKWLNGIWGYIYIEITETEIIFSDSREKRKDSTIEVSIEEFNSRIFELEYSYNFMFPVLIEILLAIGKPEFISKKAKFLQDNFKVFEW